MGFESEIAYNESKLIHPEPNITFTYIFCLLLDFPKNGIDCSNNSGTEPPICVKCPVRGMFQTGGTIDDTKSIGHYVCIFIWILIVLIGFIGTITNCIIIAILRRNKPIKPFDVLLLGLAVFDLICSVMTVVTLSAIITFFENWDRGPVTLNWIYLSFLTALFGRTGSNFMTVLICAERYAFLAFPFKSQIWLTRTKAALLALAVLAIAVLLSVPRYSSLYVGSSNLTDIPSLLGLEYIIQSTPMERFWFGKMYAIHDQIDFWTPFPLLIILNVLIQYEICKITRQRKELQVTRKKDIRAVQMFIPVIIVLFLCNILPIAHYMVIHFTGIMYREQVLGMLLSVAVNSAVNLPIYYCRGSAFRKEARAVLFKLY